MAGDEVVLRPSKLKTISLLGVSAAFVAIGALALRHQAAMVGWLCMIFFGAGCIIFLVQLLPGASYLRMNDEGFEFSAIFRKSPFIRWKDVSEFRVAKLPPIGHRMVLFDWYSKPTGGVRRLNRMVAGATDGIPDNYGMKHQQLADLLNSRRSRATSRR